MRRLVALSSITAILATTAAFAGSPVPLTLDYNFNGMVHAGEAGLPDAPAGFRAISDRALDLTMPPTEGGQTFGDLSSPNTGFPYDIEDGAGALDIIHLGDRNTVDGGNWAFDAVADGDDIGIQPTWLPSSDQTSAGTTVQPPVMLDSASEIGLLYQISNGGGDFDVTLGFDDATTVTVTLNGPDWFGPFGGTPDPPGPGVAMQANVATDFFGTASVDQANPDANLIVTEAVIGAAELLGDLGFDADGKVLESITFDNRANTNGGYAILAATAVGLVVPVELERFEIE